MTIVESAKENERCCSCSHNIRKGEIGHIECECEIDGHYIGYVGCFVNVCEEWNKAESE